MTATAKELTQEEKDQLERERIDQIRNENINRYRAMRASVAGKSDEEQRDAINNFRAGY